MLVVPAEVMAHRLNDTVDELAAPVADVPWMVSCWPGGRGTPVVEVGVPAPPRYAVAVPVLMRVRLESTVLAGKAYDTVPPVETTVALPAL